MDVTKAGRGRSARGRLRRPWEESHSRPRGRRGRAGDGQASTDARTGRGRPARVRRVAEGVALPSAGIVSMLPGTPWFGRCVARWRGNEVRCLVQVRRRRGLDRAVVLRSAGAWSGEVRAVLRPVGLGGATPTWRWFDPDRGRRWSEPGGCGAEDSAHLAWVSFAAGGSARRVQVPSGVRLVLIRRLDEGLETLGLWAESVRSSGGRTGG